MTEQGYNGWVNYPTWNAALWINNDQATQEWAREIVTSDPDAQPADMADELEAWADECLYPEMEAGPASDLLNYATAQIDWREIAESLGEE